MAALSACVLGWARFSHLVSPGIVDAGFLVASALVVVLAVRELVLLMQDPPGS
jgi:hypothetical protein